MPPSYGTHNTDIDPLVATSNKNEDDVVAVAVATATPTQPPSWKKIVGVSFVAAGLLYTNGIGAKTAPAANLVENEDLDGGVVGNHPNYWPTCDTNTVEQRTYLQVKNNVEITNCMDGPKGSGFADCCWDSSCEVDYYRVAIYGAAKQAYWIYCAIYPAYRYPEFQFKYGLGSDEEIQCCHGPV